MTTLVRLADAGLAPVRPPLAACGKEASQKRRVEDGGGTLTMLAASDVDFLDPGHTYYSLGPGRARHPATALRLPARLTSHNRCLIWPPGHR